MEFKCSVFFTLQDRMESIGIQADQFVNSGHFDADNIKTKQDQVVQRYDALQVETQTSFE